MIWLVWKLTEKSSFGFSHTFNLEKDSICASEVICTNIRDGGVIIVSSYMSFQPAIHPLGHTSDRSFGLEECHRKLPSRFKITAHRNLFVYSSGPMNWVHLIHLLSGSDMAAVVSLSWLRVIHGFTGILSFFDSVWIRLGVFWGESEIPRFSWPDGIAALLHGAEGSCNSNSSTVKSSILPTEIKLIELNKQPGLNDSNHLLYRKVANILSLSIKCLSCIEPREFVWIDCTSSSTTFPCAWKTVLYIKSLPLEQGARPLNRSTYHEKGLHFSCFFRANRSEISPISIVGFPWLSSLILADL